MPAWPWSHRLLLTINLVSVVVFGAVFLARGNHEFVIYAGVIVVCLVLIVCTRGRVSYSLATLVGLTVWSALHLAGGGVPVADGRLYDVMLLPLADPEVLPVLRYDQLVHTWGFGTATLLVYDLLRPAIPGLRRHPVALGIVLVMAGTGVGAINEVLEFAVDTAVPASGVGGYLNTSLDLCANLLGASLATAFVLLRRPGRRAAAEATPA